MDHLRELQGRLFSTVFVFILVAAAAYPFFDKIATYMMMPLKPEQQLVYLTPGGAFSFIIQVCAYIGLIGTLPIIIFHVYRFIMPAVRKVVMHTVLFYTIASLFLAAVGIAFAYYVSLPASLYFLTSFNLNHINPMLTIDAYMSFVMTYLLAGAILFQLPLVMMIINSVKPLTPAKLMKAQGKIILGSFIIAAIISPTPDALNQTLLASPMVVMYQVGIVLIWWKNRRRRPAVSRQAKEATIVAEPVKKAAPTHRPVVQPVPLHSVAGSSSVHATVLPKQYNVGSRQSMDMVRRQMARPVGIAVPMRPRPQAPALSTSPQRIVANSTPSPRSLDVRSLDGVVRTRRIA